MNNGLSPELEQQFIDITPVDRPKPSSTYDVNPNWLTGFIDGEGCFYINTTKSKTKVGYAVNLTFSLDQHSRDSALIQSIANYLNCGYVSPCFNVSHVRYTVSKFSDIIEIILPFFKEYPLQGVKNLDLNDFYIVAQLMKDKAHLTHEGLEQIKKIKAGMNKRRLHEKGS
jgi:hypothetical protein